LIQNLFECTMQIQNQWKKIILPNIDVEDYAQIEFLTVEDCEQVENYEQVEACFMHIYMYMQGVNKCIYICHPNFLFSFYNMLVAIFHYIFAASVWSAGSR
jgi:hypothetical protein